MLCFPSLVTYSNLLDATCKESGYKQAMVLLDEMRAKGCEPDILTYNVVINAMCSDH
jgi:pentatricopeptide repeat protein